MKQQVTIQNLSNLKQDLNDLNQESNLPEFREHYMRVLDNPSLALDTVQDVMTLIVLVERYKRVATTAINVMDSQASESNDEGSVDDYRVLLEETNEIERNWQTEKEVQSA